MKRDFSETTETTETCTNNSNYSNNDSSTNDTSNDSSNDSSSNDNIKITKTKSKSTYSSNLSTRKKNFSVSESKRNMNDKCKSKTKVEPTVESKPTIAKKKLTDIQKIKYESIKKIIETAKCFSFVKKNMELFDETNNYKYIKQIRPFILLLEKIFFVPTKKIILHDIDLKNLYFYIYKNNYILKLNESSKKFYKYDEYDGYFKPATKKCIASHMGEEFLKQIKIYYDRLIDYFNTNGEDNKKIIKHLDKTYGVLYCKINKYSTRNSLSDDFYGMTKFDNDYEKLNNISLDSIFFVNGVYRLSKWITDSNGEQKFIEGYFDKRPKFDDYQTIFIKYKFKNKITKEIEEAMVYLEEKIRGLFPDDDDDYNDSKKKDNKKKDNKKKDNNKISTYENMMFDIAKNLSGSCDKSSIYFFVSDGGSGKSFLLNLISDAYGAFAYNIQNKYFYKKSKDDDPNKADSNLYSCKDARILTVNELDGECELKLETLKQMSGNDKITCRALKENNIEYRARYSLILTSNYRININSGDLLSDSVIRRVKIKRFPFFFTDKYDSKNEKNNKPHYRKRDPELMSKIKEEKYKIAFMHLLIKYYNILVKKYPLFDYPESDYNIQQTNEYFNSCPVKQFLNNYIKYVEPPEKIPKGKAYKYQEKFTDIHSKYFSVTNNKISAVAFNKLIWTYCLGNNTKYEYINTGNKPTLKNCQIIDDNDDDDTEDNGINPNSVYFKD
jgi:hypothetical protein